MPPEGEEERALFASIVAEEVFLLVRRQRHYVETQGVTCCSMDQNQRIFQAK